MQNIAPYFGYLASLMLIIALLVNNDVKFRWFSAFGSLSFILYGTLLHAIPVLITNVTLFSINIYYLIKIYRRQENFDIIEFTGDEKLSVKFLHFYQKDINAHFPDFTTDLLKGNLNFVVLRDLVIANMFCARLEENGDAEVLLNYTLPRYRDYKVGSYIFEKEKQFLLSKGVKKIMYKKVTHPRHLAFLKVMGFKPDSNTQYYSKTL